MLYRSVGVTGGYRKGMRFALDNEASFNIIRRDALPYGWEKGVDQRAVPPRIIAAN